MIALLDLMHVPFVWLSAQIPPWGVMTIYGLLLAWTIAGGGFVLARLGIKPIAILLIALPWVNVMALAWLALRPWPRERARPS